VVNPESAVPTSLTSTINNLPPRPHNKKVKAEKGDQRIFCSTSFLISSRLTSTRRQDDTNNETIQGKSFSKNEDENHSNEKLWLLCIGSAEED